MEVERLIRALTQEQMKTVRAEYFMMSVFSSLSIQKLM